MGLTCSASAVDPRTSANTSDSITSAPPGWARMKWSHALQKRGFRLEGRFPRKRM